ncbi:MAG: hypothetical protein ACRDJN_09535 [Chloroflexota bacterium]
MARHLGDELNPSETSPADHRPSESGVAPATATSGTAQQSVGADAPEPVIVIYQSSERDSKTRLQIVQSGFGGTAAWTAIVDTWRDTSATFALLPARVLRVVAALHSAIRVPVLAPALRPAAVRA